jgi:hypothetical protein
MMTIYSWMLFITMAMLVLYVFYKQKNVVSFCGCTVNVTDSKGQDQKFDV